MLRFATLLLIIGGLNWGLVGLFQFDLVATLFGGPTAILSRIIYTLVGLSAVYELFNMRKISRADTRVGMSPDVPSVASVSKDGRRTDRVA